MRATKGYRKCCTYFDIKKESDATHTSLSVRGSYEKVMFFVFRNYLYYRLGQFTRNYTQTTKRGLLTTNKG